MIGGVVTSSVLRDCMLCGEQIPWTVHDYSKSYAKKRYCSHRCALLSCKEQVIAARERNAADPARQKARFLQLVDQESAGDCWRWTGSILSNGYGYFSLGRRLMHAHRASYILFNGGSIPAGMNVCHQCDNQWCVNPGHLWLGTQKQNIRDAMAKGRHVPPPKTDWQNRSKPHHWQRLTEEQAREIVRRVRSGELQKTIAADFGISTKTVSKIKLGLRWPQLAAL